MLKNNYRCIPLRKKIIIVFFMLLVCTVSFSLPTDINRFFEPTGRYSYIVPSSWSVVKKQNIEFGIAIGPQNDDFYPSVYFNKEITDIEFDIYVKKVVERISIQNPSISDLSMKVFRNIDGINGVRIVFKNRTNNSLVKQYVYLYSNKSTKFGISCTSLLKSYLVNETYFDQIATSFVFEAD